ncbi:MAG: GNAT family N-acetyltransferase [Bacteroidota bacterium]
MQNTDFKVNEAEKQFELHIGKQFAFLEFFREGEKIYLTHTETPDELRGKGYAKQLVERTLQCAKDNGLIVVPSCSYVADYVNNNPKWRDILSDGYQM